MFAVQQVGVGGGGVAKLNCATSRACHAGCANQKKKKKKKKKKEETEHELNTAALFVW